MEAEAFEIRLKKLERRFFWLLCIVGILAFGLGAGTAPWWAGPAHAAENASVLHARGLVIEDDQGHPRILLGAPFPTVAQRKRQDGTTTGMLFLDQQGIDRFLVGDRIPIPQIDGRVPAAFNSGAARGHESYGAHLFDAVGNERGSYAFNSNGAAPGRAIVSLDRLTGDAWGVAVNDKDNTAFQVFNYAMPHGSAATAMNIQTSADDVNVELYDRGGQTRTSWSLDKSGTPSLKIADAKGQSITDVFGMKK
jgi:hypothetical protein